MSRLGALIVCVLAAPVVLAQDPAASAKPPEEEYQTRVAAIGDALAGEHASIGEYLKGVAMHRWARIEFNNALKVLGCACAAGTGCKVPPVAAHEKANKGLGLTEWNGEERRYEIGPNPTLVENVKKGEDADRIWQEYQKRLEGLGKKIARLYYDLGVWCQKNLTGDAEKGRAAFKKAIEYDPLNRDARTKLGHQKQKDGGWLSKEELALRKKMKEGIAKATKGQADSAKTDVEQKIGISNKKQMSDHLLIEAPHLDTKTLEILMQHAEHAYAMFHEVFDQKSLFGTGSSGARANLVILKDKGTHEKYVDVYGANLPPTYKKECKDSKGLSGGMMAETWQGDDPQSRLEDWVIHHTIMICSEHLVGGNRHWIHEGLSYYFTRLMHDSAGTHCSDMRGTGPGGQQKDFTDSTTWHIVIREWLRTGKNVPDVNKVFKCNKLSELKGGDPVKAWSLCEFLTTEHRERFIEFMQRARAIKQEDDEKTFSEVFSWSLEEFDNRWRIFAKSTYLDTK